jgi:hypothetical protein
LTVRPPSGPVLKRPSTPPASTADAASLDGGRRQLDAEDLSSNPVSQVARGHRSLDDRADPLVKSVPLSQK